MNKYTFASGVRKGVSLWIPLAVFLSVMALLMALLPITSVARADESAEEGITLSDIADQLEALDDPNLLIDELDASLDDIVAGTVAIDSLEGVEDDGVTLGEDGATAEDADPSLVDELISLFDEGPSILQAAAGPKYVIVDYTELTYIPADPDEVIDPDRGIRIGDRTRISGTWSGQFDAAGNAQTLEYGDTFSIGLPEEVQIVGLGFNLDATDGGEPWGRCEPNEATNAYDCLITNAPDANAEPYGAWQGTADAILEGGQFNIQARTGLSKNGEQIGSGPDLQGEPSGTIFRFYGEIDGPLDGRTEAIVLTDIFDDNLAYKSEVFSFSAYQGGPGGGEHLDFQESLDGNTLTVTIQPPASGVFNSRPIGFDYFLVSESGGLDEFGTVYNNTVTVEGSSAHGTARQRMQSSGNIQGVARNSFDLNKTIEGDLPAGFDAAANPFTIRVEEFAPGNFPGSPEDTYTREVIAGGDSVQGVTPRPAGWTIRITELLDKDSGPAGFQWGTPEFTGDVNASGVDAEGNAWATIITEKGANVGISLANTMEETAPRIGTLASVVGSDDNVLTVDGGTVIDTVSYFNLTPETQYELQGRIVAVAADGTVTETGMTAGDTFTTDPAQGAAVLVNGTHDITFTISAEDAARWAGQTLVIYEQLIEPNAPASDNPVAVHEDPEDADQTFLTEVPTPWIGTTAEVQDVENPKTMLTTGGTLVDTVEYRFLDPETEYRLDGQLMHVAADGTVTDTGLVGTTTFTTPAAAAGERYVSGEVEVEFEISAAEAHRYGGETLVVFEQLFEPGSDTPEVPVTVHEDPEDPEQSFRIVERVPTIGTKAEVQDSEDPKLMPLTGGTLVDTVTYTDLIPETEHRLDGQLMHVAADGTVTDTGLVGTTTFTTPAAAAGERYVSGEVEVEFEISAADAERYAGETLVVFEQLFAPGSDTPEVPVAEHEDPEDPEQSFEIERKPEIGTKAEVQDSEDPKLMPLTGGKVIDTVTYTDLKPETEYRLDGQLMHVAADGTVTDTGLVGTTIFTTPAAAAGEKYVSGVATVEFEISPENAERYAGETLVVFEQLFEPNGPTPEDPVAEHEDPEDPEQSFDIERTPEIGTRAQVDGGDKILPVTGGTVIDTVTYTDLRPETEYRLDGQLMHIVNEEGIATGIESSATFTTPAAAAGEKYVSGVATVEFEISPENAERYAGETLVVFEQLFEPNGPTPEDPVAEHEDPEDPEQSFDIEPGNDIVVTKTVTGPKGDEVGNDAEAVFQIRAEWTDILGNEQSRVFNVTPGQPVTLSGLPLDTEVTLTEIGASTNVNNVKWGDIIWSGTGVEDQAGDSASGVIVIADSDAPVQVRLENETSSNALIIIPIPIPLIPGGGSSTPPSPTEPVAPQEPTAPEEPADVAPAAPAQPGDKVAAKQPQQPQPKGLAVTGADVMWIAGGGLSVLLLGAWLVLRGRRNES